MWAGHTGLAKTKNRGGGVPILQRGREREREREKKKKKKTESLKRDQKRSGGKEKQYNIGEEPRTQLSNLIASVGLRSGELISSPTECPTKLVQYKRTHDDLFFYRPTKGRSCIEVHVVNMDRRLYRHPSLLTRVNTLPPPNRAAISTGLEKDTIIARCQGFQVYGCGCD